MNLTKSYRPGNHQAPTQRTAPSISSVELPRPVPSAGSRSFGPVLGASPPDGISLRPEVGFQREPDSVAAGEVCGLAGGAGRGNFGVKRRSLEGASSPPIAGPGAEPQGVLPPENSPAAGGPGSSWKIRKQSHPTPVRKVLSFRALRRKMRPIQGKRQRECGSALGSAVEVHTRAGHNGARTAHFTGCVTCGSAWACAVCSYGIATARQGHIREAGAKWGGKKLQMASLTVAHRDGDKLKTLNRGVSASFSRLIQGAPWKRFCEATGLEHHVRGAEPTHGVNGWHPHLHVLLFFKGVPALDKADERWGLVSSEDIKGETMWCVVPKSYEKREKLLTAGWRFATARRWLEARWARCVVHQMGEAHRPSSQRGALITPIDERRPDYLVKLGLEMSDAGSKEGRKGSRTAWQIAADWAAHPTKRDAALWSEYAAAYKGMRKLTWSRGAQEALLPEVPELSDEELAQAADQKDGADDEVVCKLDHRVYRVLWTTGLDVDFLAAVEAGLRGLELAERLNELLRRTINAVIPIMGAA